MAEILRVLEKSGLSLSDQLPRNDGITTTVGEALMAPTVIYVKQVGSMVCYVIHIIFPSDV
jgi:phosphoribosylformylglycinamidine cyclo-ligase